MKDLYDKQEEECITQAIEEMKREAGSGFSLEKLNLSELGRRSGVSRMRLQQTGFPGGLTAVKMYIAAHRDLVPSKRHLVEPQGNRGRRYETKPGEAFQMDWSFAKVVDYTGGEYQVTCFAMCCHHCGTMFIEFFPNAKQENLFIGMTHAFQYMGIPKYVLTDNMKSVVDHRNLDGKSVWNREYETFMDTVGFKTKLCKARHPYTKGKVAHDTFEKFNFSNVAQANFINCIFNDKKRS